MRSETNIGVKQVARQISTCLGGGSGIGGNSSSIGWSVASNSSSDPSATGSIISREPSFRIITSSPGSSNSRGIRTAWFRPFLKSLARRLRPLSVLDAISRSICQVGPSVQPLAWALLGGSALHGRNQPVSRGREWNRSPEFTAGDLPQTSELFRADAPRPAGACDAPGKAPHEPRLQEPDSRPGREVVVGAGRSHPRSVSLGEPALPKPSGSLPGSSQANRAREGYTDSLMAPSRKDRQGRGIARLLQRFPRRQAAWNRWIAFVLLCLFQPGDAISQVRLPAESAAEFERGLAHFRAGSYETALQVIEPLGSRYPENAEIQHLLAIILDLNRRPEEANRHFRQAVELQPRSVGFRTNFGASLMRLGQASEAERQFRHALELEPNHPTASFNLGTTLLQQGRPEDALPVAGEGALDPAGRLSRMPISLPTAVSCWAGTRRQTRS